MSALRNLVVCIFDENLSILAKNDLVCYSSHQIQEYLRMGIFFFLDNCFSTWS